MSSLNFERYSSRTYIISEGDSLSAEKVVELENRKRVCGSIIIPLSLVLIVTQVDSSNSQSYSIISLPRARRVHQSFLSTPPTFLKSLLHAIGRIFLGPALRWQPFADVLILNGPGTCVPVCLAAYTSRVSLLQCDPSPSDSHCHQFFGFPAPRLIYVESFARVKSLSLSGRLLRPFVDRWEPSSRIRITNCSVHS